MSIPLKKYKDLKKTSNSQAMAQDRKLLGYLLVYLEFKIEIIPPEWWLHGSDAPLVSWCIQAAKKMRRQLENLIIW